MCATIMCTALSSSGLFIFTVVLSLSIFCKCSLFIRRKNNAMECVSNAGIWEMFLCEMGPFPFLYRHLKATR